MCGIIKWNHCAQTVFLPRCAKNSRREKLGMENKKNKTDYYTIDLIHIMRTLLHRAWIIILVGLLCAAAGFAYSAFVIPPSYSAQVLLYVNNSSFNIGSPSFSISASDLQASQSLVKTYTVILRNRTTLERVIEDAGVKYSSGQINGMITAGAANDTEVMQVIVTCGDPYEAATIANSIAKVLPVRISEIIDGASMEVVDSAVPITSKVAPSITRYTAVALVAGALVTALIIAVIAVMDDTIYGEEYVIENYDYPILAKIPNLVSPSSRPYGGYGTQGKK